MLSSRLFSRLCRLAGELPEEENGESGDGVMFHIPFGEVLEFACLVISLSAVPYVENSNWEDPYFHGRRRARNVRYLVSGLHVVNSGRIRVPHTKIGRQRCSVSQV